MGRRKTHEEFITELNNVNPNIEVLSQYVMAKEKVLCRCKIDSNEWYATPSHLLNNRGCPKCKANKISENLRSSHDEFIDKLKQKHPHIKAMSEYDRSCKKMTFFCTIHNYKFERTPNGILSSNFGCSKCGNRYHTRTIDEVNKFLSDNNFEVVCLKYAGSEKDISVFRCLKDDTEFEETYKNIKHKQAICPTCSKKYDQNKFVNKMRLVNQDIEIIGQFKTISAKIKCKCKICGHIWYPVANNISNNKYGCPQCCKSKGEIKIEKLLTSLNINFEVQKQFEGLVGTRGGNLSYDFYLRDYNLLIEYQGQFHDGTAKLQNKTKLKRQQEHDRRKRKYARIHNIELLEIWYQDYDNIKQILLNKIIKLKGEINFGKNKDNLFI